MDPLPSPLRVCISMCVCVCVCVCECVCVEGCTMEQAGTHKKKKLHARHQVRHWRPTAAAAPPLSKKKGNPKQQRRGLGFSHILLSFLFLFFNSPFFFLSIQLESILSQCTGFSSMFTEFYRVLLGFSQLHLWITGFYRVLRRCTGFLSMFTEFYRVLLGFTAFQRIYNDPLKLN